MREGEGRDHKGACKSGSCAFDGIDTAAGDDKSAGAEAEGEEFVCTFEGVQGGEEAVLGEACMGERIFLCEQWECDG